MNNQIVRMLPTFEAAEAARNSLLAKGFDGNGIDVNVTTDEAGPAESNFYVGDSPPPKAAPTTRMFSSLLLAGICA